MKSLFHALWFTSDACGLFTLPGKRKLELLDKPVGHIVTQHAVLFGPDSVTLGGAAKQVVQKGIVRGIVGVQRFLVLAVVPVVEVGGDESLSEILCVRHNMSKRKSMYAKQNEISRTSGQQSGVAAHS
jgi:hypothetical protein